MTGILGAAALAGYAVALATAVPPVLRRAGWVLRAPGLAIGMWLAVSVSWLTALVLAGLVLARPWLAGLAAAWFPHAAGLTSRGPGADVVLAAAVPGAGLAGGGLARAGYLLARELARGRRVRRRHAEALACAGRPAVLSAAQPAAMVVDTETPAVYCLPGRGRRQQVVVTSGALRALDQGQLDAVLAHERAHLRCRHHLVNWTAGALALSFPGIPLLRHARQEIAILAEMAADDAACREHGAATVASALVTLATARVPEPALGAGGHTVVCRLERMLDPAPPLRLPGWLAGTGAAAGALVTPVVMACACLTLAAGAAAAAAGL